MQQTSKKEILDKAWLSGEDDPLGIVQEIKIWPCWQMVYAQTRNRPRKWDAINSLGIWDTNGSPIPARIPDVVIINKN